MIETTFGNLVAAGSIVDLDGTFVVQLAVFLIFWILIYVLVVKPMMRVYELRFSRMAGARKEAEAMDLRAARAHSDYEEQVAVKRQAAVAVRDALKDAAAAKRRDTIAAARTEVDQAAAQAQTSRNVSREDALKEVAPQAEALAEAIVDRLLGKAG